MDKFRPYIVENKIKCNECGDIIESKSTHDFVWCECGNVAVDGGKQYLKRCAKKYDGISSAYEDLSVIRKPQLTITEVFECSDYTLFKMLGKDEMVCVLIETNDGKRLYEEETGSEVSLTEKILAAKFEVIE